MTDYPPWSVIAQALPSLTQGRSSFGSTMALARNNGNRLAVGDPTGSGSITLFELQQSTTTGETNYVPFQLLQGDGDDGSLSSGIGRDMSMSPDGSLFAIRNGNGDAVHTYANDPVSSSTTPSLIPLGDVHCPDGSTGTNVLLEQVVYPYPMDFLVLSCDSWNDQRGLVQVYSLEENNHGFIEWMPYLPPLQGDSSSASFGRAVDMTPSFSSNNAFRLAIGSPNYLHGRGMVQVFTAHPGENDSIDGHWSQLGEDILTNYGFEAFGGSLALSRTEEDPYLLIGAPRYYHETLDTVWEPRGRADLYHFRTPVGSPYFDDKQWEPVGESPMFGIHSGDALGTAVAIAGDGGRVAVSAPHYNDGNGMVRMFERLEYDLLGFMGGQIEGTGSFGSSLVMTTSGSLLLAGAPRNTEEPAVRAYLDTSGFCKLPTTSTPDAFASESLNTYLDRNMCRSGANMVFGFGCTDTRVFTGDGFTSCEWYDGNALDLTLPSDHPTSAPTTASITNAPTTQVPTSRPTTVAPTSQVPTRNPTVAPTRSPTAAPTTRAPTMMPSIAASGAPSTVSGVTQAPTTPVPTSQPSTSEPTAQPIITVTSQPYVPPSPNAPTTQDDSTGAPTEETSAVFNPSATGPSMPSPSPTSANYEVNTCVCDDDGQCLSSDSVAMQAESTVNICASLSPAAPNDMVFGHSLELQQSPYFLKLMEDGNLISPSSSGMLYECLPQGCHFQVPLPSDLFKPGNASQVTVSGSLLVGSQQSVLRGSVEESSGQLLYFNTVVGLAVERQIAAGSGITDESTESAGAVVWVLGVIFLLILIAGLTCCIRKACKERRQRQQEEEVSPPEPADDHNVMFDNQTITVNDYNNQYHGSYQGS